MIRIQTLHVENFRGIRHLTLDFRQKNFAIYGPNGTGKSGIVDAIEFVLTGNVTRLAGRGTGGISVKTHGPHVDCRDVPAKAYVRLEAFAPALNRSFSIERRVSTPTKPVVTPADDPQVLALATQLAGHPEFALSRREILKYVIAEAGQRSKEVQALLRLDDIETLRSSLQRIANECKRTVKAHEDAAEQARIQLMTAVKISAVTGDQLLAAVNERRKVLGLASLVEITRDTSLRDGVSVGGKTAATPRVSKATALADLAELEAAAARSDTEGETINRTQLIQLFKALRNDPKLLFYLRRRDFLARGLDLAIDPACPLCDTPWNNQELRALIDGKLRSANAADQIRRRIDTAVAPIGSAINIHLGLIRSVRKHAEQLEVGACSASMLEWERSLSDRAATLTSLESTSAAIDAAESAWRAFPDAVERSLVALKSAIAVLPDPSVEDEAKEYLLVAQERLDAYRAHRRRLAAWKARSDLARVLAESFEEASRMALTALYDDVEKEFSRFYATIHHDDEAQFRGQLTPSLGKLGFEVDFHRKGLFPPAAYHSEGHQDSMGLCLYLALMKRVLGAEFHLAVLDDVLMSIDAGHRREVCRLLKKEFPQTQFVFTTHDRVWLHHLVSEGLVDKAAIVEFRDWSVEEGPEAWDFVDVWTDIENRLANQDVASAAHTLRLYLERVAADLAARLRARVEYRQDHAHVLGDLMEPILSRYAEILRKGKAAAHSWGRSELFTSIEERLALFEERRRSAKAALPLLNPTVHYNDWNNVTAEEVRAVADAFKSLLESFQCGTCGTLLYVEPRQGPTEALRCDCAATMVNLKSRSKSAA